MITVERINKAFAGCEVHVESRYQSATVRDRGHFPASEEGYPYMTIASAIEIYELHKGPFKILNIRISHLPAEQQEEILAIYNEYKEIIIPRP